MANELQTKLDRVLNEKNTKLLPENLRKDITCLGVTGTMEGGIDTSDANATSIDIVADKTAYVNGQKITGIIPEAKANETIGTIDMNKTIYGDWGNGYRTLECRFELDCLQRENSVITVPITNPNMTINLVERMGVTPDKIVKGQSIMGVEGTFTGNSNVKLFSDKETMMNTAANENDYALVYQKQLSNITGDTISSYFIFPYKVVLPEAMTEDSVYLSWGSVNSSVMCDISCGISSSSFHMNIMGGDKMFAMDYTSSDGITYTRSMIDGDYNVVDGKIDFGVDVKLLDGYTFDNRFGYFMKLDNSEFDGVYQYVNDTSTTNFNAVTNFSINTESKTLSSVNEPMYLPNLLQINYDIRRELLPDGIGDYTSVVTKEGDDYYLYCIKYLDGSIGVDSESKDIFILWVDNNSSTSDTQKYLINFDTNSYQLVGTVPRDDLITRKDSTSTKYKASRLPAGTTIVASFRMDGIQSSNGFYTVIDNMYDLEYKNNVNVPWQAFLHWAECRNSFGATSSYVFEKSFYGKDGVDVGTMQEITDNPVEIRKRLSVLNALEHIPCPEDMGQAFMNMTDLTHIPVELDMSSTSNMYATFKGCINLIDISNLNTPSAFNMSSTFYDCTSLVGLDNLITDEVNYIASLCYNCTSLRYVPILNSSKYQEMSNMFKNCPDLLDESLDNILVICTNATSYTRTKTLAYIGLSAEQATKCTTLPNYSAFTRAGWTTGY